MWQIVRFVAVGLLNTALGAGTIFLLMWVGVSAVPANLCGYALGLCSSFLLNRSWTFKSRRPASQALGPFIAVFAVAYLANLAVLVAGIDMFGWNPYAVQAVAIGLYTLVSFVGFRRFAFRG